MSSVALKLFAWRSGGTSQLPPTTLPPTKMSATLNLPQVAPKSFGFPTLFSPPRGLSLTQQRHTGLLIQFRAEATGLHLPMTWANMPTKEILRRRVPLACQIPQHADHTTILTQCDVPIQWSCSLVCCADEVASRHNHGPHPLYHRVLLVHTWRGQHEPSCTVPSCKLLPPG